MLPCFADETAPLSEKTAAVLHVLDTSDGDKGFADLSPEAADWAKVTGFRIQPGAFVFLPPSMPVFAGTAAPPAEIGDLFPAQKPARILHVLAGVDSKDPIFSVSALASTLPPGLYRFAPAAVAVIAVDHRVLGWGLGVRCGASSSESEAEAASETCPRLLVSDNSRQAQDQAEAVMDAKILINMPANRLTPVELANKACDLLENLGAETRTIIGKDLQKKRYPLIFTVGRGSEFAPRLVIGRWQNPKAESHAPLVAIVGKGVCFDTGGLDLKPSRAMLLMKKDMGGAAHALALARMIIRADCPVRLAVFLPIVENAVSSRAFRPLDILQSRKGLTVEVGNTDAEGRLILADALTAAGEDKPDAIIDFATLTGAARIATGPELPNLFCSDPGVASEIHNLSLACCDPVWPMPLWQDYRRFLNSDEADLNNAPAHPYAGSILAALFLQEFVPKDTIWIHLDLMAWSLDERPGHPKGGDIQSVRTLFSWIDKRYRAQS